MATAKELGAIMTDLRLTPNARCIVAFVYMKGDGEHEIAFEEFAGTLCHPSRGKVQEAVRLATKVGYLKRREGGRGHGALYCISRTHDGLLSAFSSPPDGLVKDGAEDTGMDLGDRQDGTYPNSRPPAQLLNGPHTCEQAEPLVGRKDVRKEPPVVPLSIQAEDAFAAHADRLTGLRGSLRDYLVARLSGNPTSQAAYVHRVVTMLDDPGAYFRGPDGELVPEPDRPKVIAQALNELLQHGEQRTILPGMERMKWPDGDSRNLRTKIRILIQQRYDDEHRGNGVRYARAAAAATPGTSGASSLSGERRNGFGDPD
jgi:hypothetical protein